MMEWLTAVLFVVVTWNLWIQVKINREQIAINKTLLRRIRQLEVAVWQINPVVGAPLLAEQQRTV